ncbi:unnamed protein product [Cyprideis torosa]|uniref:Aurora kinase n=1 Tax=Cyprideis torosa TaxID=163714 RepID=A0A7R8W9Z2_9CRUS|nr:unnamed protein product [Cyprideis torosa]CAG0890375.1 unnamed protein product [Cyprideis torosa]
MSAQKSDFRLRPLTLEELQQPAENIPDDYKEWKVHDFEAGFALGSGRFGRVFLVRETKTELNFLLAMKVLFKAQLSKYKMEHQLRREIEIHQRVKHPNIVRLFTWINHTDKIFLLLEYAPGGDMYTHLSKLRRFTERRTATYVWQISDALSYCHSKGVIHRDMKPENILIGARGQALLADFGWAAQSPKESYHGCRKTGCGTTDYMAPEIISRMGYDAKIDNWCIGVLCYELLVGKPPFESKDTKETYKKITSVTYTFPDSVKTGPRDLISKLLVAEPKKRLAMKDVITHEWVVEKATQDPIPFPDQ